MDGVASAVNAIEINAARATVLLVVALLLAVLLRRSAAAARHQLWAGVIVGLLLLPAASLLAPPVVLPWLAPPRPAMGPQVTLPAAAPAPWLPPVGVPTAPPVRVEVSGENPRIDGAPLVVRPAVWVPRALGAAWLLGTTLILVRFARGRWRAGRMRRGTEPADPVIWPVPTGMEVREGGAVELPMTVGALRPVILVPAEEGRRWPASWRAAVIEHEAAHVRRWDPLWQALAELACALYWFHPLVWLAARQLRTERELAADDDVLLSGQRPSEYADLLITLGCLPAMPPTTGAVLPLLTPAGLKARLMGIIDGTRRRAVGVVGRAALAGMGCLFFVPTAGAMLVSPPTSGFFNGMTLACVRDERTHQPIVGAEVDIWDGAELAQRVLSDARGCFRWFREAPHSGELVAYVRKGALAGRRAMFPGRFGTVLPATLDVRPGLSVSGTIRDEEGRPLPGALVRVVSSERWARGPGPDTFTLARADGQFTFEGLLYGKHRLYFEGPAGGVATELVRLDEQNLTGLVVTIRKAPPITGYLVSEDHHPVVGARVEDAPIYPVEAGRRLRGRHIEWDTSDGDGAFRVAFIGRTLRATGRDRSGRLVTAAFADFERPPSPAGNPGAWDGGRPAVSQTILMRQAGVIRGSLRFPDGTPAAGAYINGLVFAKGRNTILADQSARASADEQGRFVLGPLPLGEVELRAMSGPRSDPPYQVRGVRQRVTVSGESDPPLDLILEWQLESSLGPAY
jgi:hypothetical protein